MTAPASAAGILLRTVYDWRTGAEKRTPPIQAAREILVKAELDRLTKLGLKLEDLQKAVSS